MPRPAINLEPFRSEIEHRIAAGENQNQIREWLATEGVSISKNIFSKRIVDWRLSRSTTISPINSALVSAIGDAFYTAQYDDQTIAQNITSQGIPTTHNQVKEIRLAHNWHRRAYNEDQAAQQKNDTFTLIEQALQLGECRCYGREMMKTYLRIKFGHKARDNDIRNILPILDEKGTDARRSGSKKKHMGGEYVTPGPDWLWCIDGHDKFRNYGIEIYAGVDAFSRRIQWCYVGNSNRRAVSILHQMVTTIQAYDRCPSFFRSDRGKEVLLLADAQFSLYVLHRKANNTCPEDENSLRLRECYMFGTSTANVRIESTWMRMLRSQTKPWLEYFTYLQTHGLYESDALEDRIVLLFVFTPIIRSEISTYVEVWNSHCIRPQKYRFNHAAGVPNDLYTNSSLPRYGWRPDSEFVGQLKEAVKDVDPDAFLSDDTVTWCEQTLMSLNHPGNPMASEFLPHTRHFLVPTWYRQLRIKTRDHIESGENPKLSLAPKPDTSQQWQARQQIIAEMRNEVDTFGLIETGQDMIANDEMGQLIEEEILDSEISEED